MYSKILVPIDTTYQTRDWMRAPLEAAHDFAKKSKGSIYAISVIPDNLLEGYYPNLYTKEVANETRQKLSTIVKHFCPQDANVIVRIEEGGICSEILRVARELPADLIVMASHGPIMRDYFLGSNAGHIALHAPCSVFVVREMHCDAEAVR